MFFITEFQPISSASNNNFLYNYSLFEYRLLLKTENWKHFNKIIFKCVNSTVRSNFKVAFLKKKILASLVNSTWDPLKNARRVAFPSLHLHCFSVDLVHCSQDPQVLYSATISLKLGPTILFTHLKIILL